MNADRALKALRETNDVLNPAGRTTGSSGDTLAGLLAEVEAAFKRYVVMGTAEAATLPLYVAHTHTFAAADFTPYLSINSPEKGSGKSTLLKVLNYLVARPIPAANMSDAVLFRLIESRQPTLLFDEIDAIFGPKARDREDLRAMFNAGFERGAQVWRMGGKNFSEIESFDVFCPKAFAGIGKLPDTMRDRSIEIALKRKKAGESVGKFLRREVMAELVPLHDRLAEWAEGAVDALSEMEPVYLPLGDDRAMDLWEPLARVAALAGGDWPKKAELSALHLSSSRRAPDDDSLGVRMLADLRSVFLGDAMATKDLIAALCELPESGWADYRNGRGLNDRALASLVKGYGIRPDRVRPHGPEGEQVRGYRREQFTDDWERYLPCDGSCDASVTDTQHPANPDEHRVCDGKTDQSGGIAGGNGSEPLTAAERDALKAEIDAAQRAKLDRRTKAHKANPETSKGVQ